jgi:perosamine synthetase
MVIPVCEPTIGKLERKYVNDCLKTNWISSMGKYVTSFEEKFAKLSGCVYGVSCSNGTAALHLALVSLGIKEGDEVIVPNFTMIATANAITYCGAIPVFVDVEKKSWTINPLLIEEKITPKTKAIMVMHTYGNPCDMKSITRIAQKHGLYVIEDAAQAHGATYEKIPVGSLGDVACFSFYANKTLTCGEGGMITTNNKDIANKARYYKNHCFGEPRFIHQDIGYNYRLTNIQAAIGLAQTENAEKHIQGRKNNGKYYAQYLRHEEGILLPPKNTYGSSVPWMCGIIIRNNIVSGQELRIELEKEGIETRAFFFPLHKQPCFQNQPNINTEGEYPVSDWLFEHGFYLPSSSHLTKKEIKMICDKIKEIIRSYEGGK